MSTLSYETWQAYHQTSYWVHAPGRSIGLTIGIASPEFDAILAAAGHQTWCVLTAENPRSQQLSDAENAARQAALKSALVAANIGFWPTEARAADGNWPAEHGWCLLDVPHAVAAGLGKSWDQWAVVWGELGSSPELVWLDESASKAAADYSSGKR